jgi:hypothetical protein
VTCLIFSSRQCVHAFTSFLRRYLQSMQLMQIASIVKVSLALTRLLLQAQSENLPILSSGTTRRVLGRSCWRLLVCDNQHMIVAYEKKPA